MSRAIVHKTKGKLDLRSLTVFGMNAKPETDTPIGYFGTGLKYAVAVLMRHRIPVSIWIDGKKWTVEENETKFRGKDFGSIFLKNVRTVGWPRTLELPFTTELGKNWEIWQAFRELESNTRDEKGMTFTADVTKNGVYVIHGVQPEYQQDKGWTLICVEDERYVQAYHNKNEIFLEDGLTAQTSSEYLQVFARKSDWIYYRGIRIHKLKETANNTYNFLKFVELTEDRTAKYPYALEMDIERYLAHESKDSEIVERAVRAPPLSYERTLSYDYTPRGELFLDTVTRVGDDATDYAKSILRRDRPPEEPKKTYVNWIRDLIAAINRGDYDRVEEVIRDHASTTIQVLKAYAVQMEKEETNNAGSETSNGLVGGDQQESGPEDVELGDANDPKYFNSPTVKHSGDSDDIPF